MSNRGPGGVISNSTVIGLITAILRDTDSNLLVENSGPIHAHITSYSLFIDKDAIHQEEEQQKLKYAIRLSVPARIQLCNIEHFPKYINTLHVLTVAKRYRTVLRYAEPPYLTSFPYSLVLATIQ